MSWLKRFYAYLEGKTQAFPALDLQPPPNRLLPFIWHYCRGFRLPFAFLMLATTLYGAFEALLFSFLGEIVDWLQQRNQQDFFAQEALTLIGMGVVVLLLLPLLNALGTVVRHQMIMGNLPMAIRWRMHHYLLQQSMAFYQDEFSGRIASRVMQTALAIRQVMNTFTDVLAYAVVYFASIVILLALQHRIMLYLILIWFGVYLLLMRYFIPRLASASEAQSGARALMTGRITDAYTNIMTIKLFAHHQRERDYARGAMQDFLSTVYRQMRLAGSLDIALTSLNLILIFMVGAAGIMLWQQNHISAGGVAIAIAAALRLKGMSHWILWEVSSLFEHIGTVRDGMSMMARPIAITDQSNADKLTVTRGEIRFENVSFAYHAQQALHVLHDFSLHVRPGEKIGIVGRSGAGKSTLVNLLLRFYDVQSGKILIDGQNIAAITQESLRQNIAMVTQDTSLLHRSVRDNVLYGKPEADEEALLQALKQAEAFDFVQHLRDPAGRSALEAQVGERGIKLSGGQRQRLAIARVMLKNAPILILDEATSALDSEVEAAIQSSLLQLMENKTVLAIAHRLSTIAMMDRLIVLDQGRIVEEGTHEALLAQKGLYAQLWARQTGGYLMD